MGATLEDNIGVLVREREGVEERLRGLLSASSEQRRDMTPAEAEEFDRLADDLDKYRGREAQLRSQVGNVAEMHRFAGAADAVGGDRQRSEFGEIIRQMANKERMAAVEIIPSDRDVRRTMYAPGMQVRALGTGSASAGGVTVPASVWGDVMTGMLTASGVLAAGATVIHTTSGEALTIPRGTVGAAAWIDQGATITGTDPSFSGLTLKAWKVGQLVKVNRELIDDSGVNVAKYVADQAGLAIGQAIGAKLVNGTGTNEVRGFLVDATTGVTGPTGTATSFGSQQTAGQGTDLINNLYGSVLEPYAAAPAAAFVIRGAALTSIKNLKSSTGETIGNTFVANAGAPFFPDPWMPVPAAGATSVAFGDWSRYWVRFSGPIRIEASDQFAWDTDQITFRATARVDGGLVDPAAIKVFKHSAT